MSNYSVDKAEYAELKRQEKQQYNQDLAVAMGEMATDPFLLRTYLEVQGRLPAYSVGNAIMISRQFPAARQVKLSTEWADMGVKPLKGVKGIAILVPGNQYNRPDGSIAQGYDVRRAFDISQTSAGAHQKVLPRPSNQNLLRALLDYQKGAWLFQTVDDGEPALYYPDINTIVIRRQQQFLPLFSALAREIICADLLMRKKMAREDAFPLASCITWMLCSHYHIDPVGIDLPNDPAIVMGTDSQNYRKQLSGLSDTLRGMVNFMDKSLAKAQRERAAAL